MKKNTHNIDETGEKENDFYRLLFLLMFFFQKLKEKRTPSSIFDNKVQLKHQLFSSLRKHGLLMLVFSSFA